MKIAKMKKYLSAFMCAAFVFSLLPAMSFTARAAASAIYVDVNGSDTSGDGTLGNPYQTLQEAVSESISGDTVHLAPGTYAGSGNKAITISKDLTIEGASQTGAVLDAENSGQIFAISSGVTVSLSSLTLKDGYHNGGGAIYNRGTLNVTNCVLTNNTSDYGGAIYNQGTVTVTNCDFTNNEANTSGGAIDNHQGNLTVTNCTFTNNTSAYGGAIYNQGTVTVTNCDFTNNKANTSGGAIGNQGNLTVTNCTFVGNTSDNDGGAIDNQGYLAVTSCAFTYNTSDYGGAIYNNNINGSTTIVHFCRFSGNTALSGSVIFSNTAMDAECNWWGSNSDPTSATHGAVTCAPWLVLTINSNVASLKYRQSAEITADLNHDSSGVYYNPFEQSVPDGISVQFSANIGSLNPTSGTLTNGSATTHYTASVVGTGTVTASVDNQSVTTSVPIQPYSTNMTVNSVSGTTSQTVTLSAAVKDENGNPVNEGLVQFSVNSTIVGTAMIHNGVASFSFTIPSAWSVGSYTISADYPGDDYYGSSSQTATFAVSPVPSYIVTATPNLDFGSETAGYSTLPAVQTVTVTDTGNSAVTLTQPTSTNYTIGTLSKTVLEPTDTATFTVQPKMGLIAGNYPETITVNTDRCTSAAVDVNFTVTQASGGSGGYSPPSYTAVASSGGTLPVTLKTGGGSAAVNINDQIGKNVASGGKVTVSIPPIPGVTSCSLGIPVAYLSTSGGGTLTFNTNTGSVTLPANMLSGIPNAQGKTAEIAIGQGNKSNLPDNVKAAIENRPLISVSLTLDGVPTEWNNPSSPVTISIPYTPTAEELQHPDNIVVWYIGASGNLSCASSGHYDAATGTVSFETAHFSDYAIGYNNVRFNDVAQSAWYYGAVNYIAARNIANGTGDGNYSPEARLTRADFLVLLLKTYGIAPVSNLTENFADSGNTYYTGYLMAAKKLDITNGVGGNMFVPEKEITRQEMFALLYRALNVIGQLPQGDTGRSLADFSDAGQVSPWARDAMALFVKTGTVSGMGSLLNPTGTTTRAEMAQVLYNLRGR